MKAKASNLFHGKPASLDLGSLAEGRSLQYETPAERYRQPVRRSVKSATACSGAARTPPSELGRPGACAWFPLHVTGNAHAEVKESFAADAESATLTNNLGACHTSFTELSVVSSSRTVGKRGCLKLM